MQFLGGVDVQLRQGGAGQATASTMDVHLRPPNSGLLVNHAGIGARLSARSTLLQPQLRLKPSF
jgi:hypothetical protein